MILTKTEKEVIDKLFRCKRDKKRQHIQEALVQKQKELTEGIDDKIKNLEKSLKELGEEKQKLLKKHKLDKIDSRGCFYSHPELDKFDEETTEILIEIWKGNTEVAK